MGWKKYFTLCDMLSLTYQTVAHRRQYIVSEDRCLDVAEAAHANAGLQTTGNLLVNGQEAHQSSSVCLLALKEGSRAGGPPH